MGLCAVPDSGEVDNRAIEFVASLPAIKSAILLDGNGDGGQVKLEVDRSQVGALVLLQQWYAGETFQVTIRPDSR